MKINLFCTTAHYTDLILKCITIKKRMKFMAQLCNCHGCYQNIAFDWFFLNPFKLVNSLLDLIIEYSSQKTCSTIDRSFVIWLNITVILLWLVLEALISVVSVCNIFATISLLMGHLLLVWRTCFQITTLFVFWWLAFSLLLRSIASELTHMMIQWNLDLKWM
jgi:hypothetical protein